MAKQDIYLNNSNSADFIYSSSIKPILNRQNNFDLVRLLLALSVFFVHIYELSNLDSLIFLSHVFSSSIAVKCFFVISGYLIFMSFERSKSFSYYVQKRFFRIFPAYFVVIIMSAIFLPIYFGSLDFDNIWLIFRYVFFNLIYLNFLSPDLPSVFINNKFTAVNGALWTLKIEVMFYFTVPFLVLFFRWYKKFYVLLLIYLSSTLYFYFIDYIQLEGLEIAGELKRQLPGQLRYFIAGAFCYYYFEKFIRLSFPISILSLVCLLIIPSFLLPLFEPIALAAIVIFVCYFKYLGNFSRFGDFSYGIYIVHFPVIQLMISLRLPEQGALIFAATTFFLTVLLAILLWHCVEKRFLKTT